MQKADCFGGACILSLTLNLNVSRRERDMVVFAYMIKNTRFFAVFHPFPLRRIPLLFGWVSALLAIEEASLAEPFLFSSLFAGVWADYAYRIAFLFGLGLTIPLFTCFRRFPSWIFSLIASPFLLLGFLPLPVEVLFAFRLLSAFFLGGGLSFFGISFFLLFDNRQKAFSLFFSFLLALILPFSQTFEPWLSLAIILFGQGWNFFPRREEEPSPSLPLANLPAFWLWVLSFIAFLFQGVLVLALLRELLQKESFLALGMLIGGIAGLLLSFYFLKSRHFLLTYGLYFSFWISAPAGLLLFFVSNPTILFPLSIFFSLAHVLALFSLYYVLGVYTKKYRNLFFYNGGAILSSLAYALSLLFPILFPFFSGENNASWAIVFITIPLLFFGSLPFFFFRLRPQEWLNDLHRQEVSSLAPLDAFFADHHLSKREQEVARLLVKGLTLRQIAGELHLSYPTINTYQTALYRKLKINSRAELLLLCQPWLNQTAPH